MMISSIAPSPTSSKVTSTLPAEGKTVTPQEKTETSSSIKPSVEFSNKLPKTEFNASTSKFIEGSSSTKLARSLTPARQGEEALLRKALEVIDDKTGGFIGWNKDGKIIMSNIKEMREKVKKEGGESLGLKDASNENLSSNTVNNILNFLETALKDYGDGDSLNESQLTDAIKAVPANEVLFSKTVKL
jgi:hypothetical protein